MLENALVIIEIDPIMYVRELHLLIDKGNYCWNNTLLIYCTLRQSS